MGKKSNLLSSLLYSISENDSSDAVTSEVCMIFMLVTLMRKNSQAQKGRLMKQEVSVRTDPNDMTSQTATSTNARH